jgi:hypothetical protein
MKRSRPARTGDERPVRGGKLSAKDYDAYLALLDEADTAARGFPCALGPQFTVGYIMATHEEARKVLLMLGQDKFGPADTEIQAAVRGAGNHNRLEELTLRLKHATSWRDLLGLPALRGRANRRKRPS